MSIINPHRFPHIHMSRGRRLDRDCGQLYSGGTHRDLALDFDTVCIFQVSESTINAFSSGTVTAELCARARGY